MARPRKPLLDQLLAIYRDMRQIERVAAKYALQGFDAADSNRPSFRELTPMPGSAKRY